MNEIRKHKGYRRWLLSTGTTLALSIGLLALVLNTRSVIDPRSFADWLGLGGLILSILGLALSILFLMRADGSHVDADEIARAVVYRVQAAVVTELHISQPRLRASLTARVVSKGGDLFPDPIQDMHVRLGKADIAELFSRHERLLITGPPGSGKTTVLLLLAQELARRELQRETPRIPVVVSLSSWSPESDSFADWFVRTVSNQFVVPDRLVRW